MPKEFPGLELPPLLVTRRQAGALLGCSLTKLKTMEQLGLLEKVKLTGSVASIVHYRMSQIEALARGEPERLAS